jgi:endogenous inhibitor of DNA gyrase (YacG/DUF329 family)
MFFGRCLQCGEKTNNPKFCSNSCSAKFNNPKRRKPQFSNCINCGKEVIRKRHRNSKIKFCSNKCQNDYQRKTKLEKWISGEWDGTTGKEFKVISNYVRNYLLEKSGGECNICKNSIWLGEPIPLEIHHKDGNWKNNSPDNLEVLCPTCHAIKNRQISFSNNSPDKYRTKSRENRNKKGNGFFRG